MQLFPLRPRRQGNRRAARLLRVIWPALGVAAAYQWLRWVQEGKRTQVVVARAPRRHRSLLALAVMTSLSVLGWKFLYIRALSVDPHSQRRGVGAEVLQNIEAQAKQQGKDIIVLTSGPHRPRAQRFYLRQGFQRFLGFVFWKRLRKN